LKEEKTQEDIKQYLYEQYKINHNLNEIYYQTQDPKQKKWLEGLIEEFFERYEKEKSLQGQGNIKQNEDDKTGNYYYFYLNFKLKLRRGCYSK